ncbi:MAG: dihydrofolate reductase family protein [Acidobacteria bacterium]|nr:dihydrofolate reductase family protein [Acidobacteriota bacterium]
MPTVTPFERYVNRKEELAAAATLSGFYTVDDDTPGRRLVPIGNEWTRRLYDGEFYRGGAISLVFIQSRNGNTVADDPSTLGGGETDKHLVSLDAAVRHLRRRGIQVISTVGGRQTATALLRAGLVSDVYLTTSPIEAGEPNTPFYEGTPPPMTRVLAKTGTGAEAGVRFEHFLVEAPPV